MNANLFHFRFNFQSYPRSGCFGTNEYCQNLKMSIRLFRVHLKLRANSNIKLCHLIHSYKKNGKSKAKSDDLIINLGDLMESAATALGWWTRDPSGLRVTTNFQLKGSIRTGCLKYWMEGINLDLFENFRKRIFSFKLNVQNYKDF